MKRIQEKKMNGLRLLISAAIAATLIGCEETPDTTNQDAINESGFFAKFSPSDGIIPFPNNLLFTGTTDGTINIDTTDLLGGELAVATALNSMDGFSTVAPISARFSSAIDATTLVAGTTVRVFEITLTGGVVTAVGAELTDSDFAVSVSSVDGSDVTNPDPGANKLIITPLKPLNPSAAYAVVLTKGIKGTQGNDASADTIYAFTKSTSALVTPFPATNLDLSEVNYTALLSTADADGSGTIDAGEAAAALTSVNSLEGLRQLTNAAEAQIVAAATPAITNNEIILSWNFTTQSTAISAGGNELTIARTNAPADPIHNINSTLTYTTTIVGGAGYANIHVGTIDVPYYQAAADDAELMGDGPAQGFWENSGGAGSFTTPIDREPVPQSTQTIPLLVSIPNADSPGSDGVKPTNGWPVVIFQHGITADRTSLLAIADSLSARGFAAVAIDIPLHGLLAADATGIEAATAAFDTNTTERHFDVDYVNNTTGLAPGGDGIDTSGANFVNLSYLMTTRGNLNQAIADLFVVTKSLVASGVGTGMDYTGDGDGDFDPAKIYFVGHSLGAMVGASFLAIETNIKDAVLAMPGGGIAKLLDGSSTFGPVISAGLAANGVTKGTAEYESFLASGQMMIDGGDPVNYATTLASSSEGILMFEVIGNGVDNVSDLVIPNAVPDTNDTASTVPAVLSGTDPLLPLMVLDHLNADDATTNNLVVTKFTEGDHSSLLDPATSAAATAEMQYQAAEFLLGDGVLNVNDATVLEIPVTP